MDPRQAALMTHMRPIQSERPLADWLGSMNTMQKLGLLQVPVVSDVAGLLGDIQQYREEPESRGLLNYGLTGMGLLPFMPNMTVFHGSPHRWLPEDGFSMGRPRLDKIGTGEGAQAYGHGMYFAESPDVAKSYAETGKMPRLFIGETEIPYPKWDAGMGPREQALRFLADTVQSKKLSTRDAVKAARHMLDGPKQFLDADKVKELHAALDDLEKSNIRVMPAGEMYTLDLPDERLPDLLDWDKPLSQQSENVRKALTENYIANWLGDMDSQTGEELIARMYRSAGGDGKVIAKELAEIGIPGLRYLDAGSRGAGNGTSNFVVWDQSLLDEMARRMANMASKK